jgi:hypothetical protein
MPPITELDVLLRVQAKLPDGLKLSTEDFREGWTFARTINALRLKQRIAARGWNFIRVADVSLRSGVGGYIGGSNRQRLDDDSSSCAHAFQCR